MCLFTIHIHNSTFMSSILFLEFRYVVDKSYYMIHLVAFHNNIIIFPLMKVCCVIKKSYQNRRKHVKKMLIFWPLRKNFTLYDIYM